MEPHRRRDLMTIREAAAYMGVSERTVRQWLADKKLTKYQVPGGRIIRIDRHEVDQLMDP